MISKIYDCIVSYDGDKLDEGKFHKGVEVRLNVLCED